MKDALKLFLAYLGTLTALAACWIWASGAQTGGSVFRYVGF